MGSTSRCAAGLAMYASAADAARYRVPDQCEGRGHLGVGEDLAVGPRELLDAVGVHGCSAGLAMAAVVVGEDADFGAPAGGEVSHLPSPVALG